MLRTPRIPLLGSLACLIGLALTGVLAYLVPVAQKRDSATLYGFTELNRPRVTPLLDGFAHLADPRPYALIGLLLIGVALVRRRYRIAAVVLGLIVVTGSTTQTLKPLLAAPRYDEWLGTGQIAAASWPSGHATAAMTLALCAVLVAPARARPTVATLGAIFAISVSYSILALGWHFPSDVFGGFLVAMTWTLAAVAGLVWLEQKRPSKVREQPLLRGGRAEALGPIALGSAGAAVVTVVALARPQEVARYAAEHASFVVGAGGIAALAVVLVVSLARGVRTA
ncbi:MAG: phosphatase PAP2 family protein [Solirubrobacterales bacterium]|nr:phosphatase PAP2 family protein [Solirubrobacterales bacterium]